MQHVTRQTVLNINHIFAEIRAPGVPLSKLLDLCSTHLLERIITGKSNPTAVWQPQECRYSTLSHQCLMWRGAIFHYKTNWSASRIRVPSAAGILKTQAETAVCSGALSQLRRAPCRSGGSGMGRLSSPPAGGQPGFLPAPRLTGTVSPCCSPPRCRAAIDWKRTLPIRAMCLCCFPGDSCLQDLEKFLLTCTLSPPKNVTLD